MNQEELFERWAPADGAWSPWAKPVLFAQMSDVALALVAQPTVPLEPEWARNLPGGAAMVIDLPGAQGVHVGLSLAARGYRPVPLYNACPAPIGATAVVDVWPILLALSAGATVLRGMTIADAAAPAFLLDADRNPPAPRLSPGMFDNRSISLPTDFPSANLLLSRGIQRVVLVQWERAIPRTDLAHTLRRWQEAGISIEAVTLDATAGGGASGPWPLTVRRPTGFRVLWYNFLATLGLRASPLGGFGGTLPMPSSG